MLLFLFQFENCFRRFFNSVKHVNTVLCKLKGGMKWKHTDKINISCANKCFDKEIVPTF